MLHTNQFPPSFQHCFSFLKPIFPIYVSSYIHGYLNLYINGYGGEVQVFCGSLVRLKRCLPQISHGVTRDRTRFSVMKFGCMTDYDITGHTMIRCVSPRLSSPLCTEAFQLKMSPVESDPKPHITGAAFKNLPSIVPARLHAKYGSLPIKCNPSAWSARPNRTSNWPRP